VSAKRYTRASGFIGYVREGWVNWQLNLSASANYTVAVRYSQDGPNRPLALLIDGVQKATITLRLPAIGIRGLWQRLLLISPREVTRSA